jgi:S1-C subfamily serine protease
MTIQVPGTRPVAQPYGGQPYGGQPYGAPGRGDSDSWTSPLWGRPDTVAGYGPGDRPPAEPPQTSGPAGPPPPPRSRKRLVVVATIVALALVLTAAVAAAALRSDNSSTATPPRPSTAPSTPAHPSQPPSAAPSAPGQGQLPGFGQLPGQPGTGNQGSTLTPQQQADAAAVSKGLVDIVTTIGYNGARGAGTGIVLTSDGLVLTNHHVVAGSTKLSVTDVGNGQTYDATVVGYDRSHDVAVIKLQGASGLTVAPLGSSASVEVGDDVVAIGNAGGVGGTPSAVAGKVTGLNASITARDDSTGTAERLTGLIAFDAAIEPGDSGGALVDADGKVVGMVTAGGSADPTSDSTSGTSGFAVPIDQAHQIAQQIIDGKASSTVHIGTTAFLGIQVTGGSRAGSTQGVPVAGVVPGSAAEKAGIDTGDVVTAVDGHQVTSSDDLVAVLGTHKPGDTVTVGWTDPSGGTHSASVRLGAGPVG